MDKMFGLIGATIQNNLRIELVFWYDNSFSIRLFWGDKMFYESEPSDLVLMNLNK